MIDNHKKSMHHSFDRIYPISFKNIYSYTLSFYYFFRPLSFFLFFFFFYSHPSFSSFFSSPSAVSPPRQVLFYSSKCFMRVFTISFFFLCSTQLNAVLRMHLVIIISSSFFSFTYNKAFLTRQASLLFFSCRTFLFFYFSLLLCIFFYLLDSLRLWCVGCDCKSTLLLYG